MGVEDHMDLINRLENASEPDRQLDNAIEAASNPDDLPDWPPYFTASIDDALTLVPEDYHWALNRAPHRKGFFAETWAPTGKVVAGIGDGRTAAIALCIAALKARSNGQ